MKKIIVWVLIITGALVLSSTLLIFLFGKDILVSQIERNLKTRSSIGSLYFWPPTRFRVHKLKIGDLFYAREVSFSVNPLGFLAGKIILDGLTITEPQVTLEQSAEGKLNLPQLAEKGKSPNLIPTGIVITNGKFIFTDRKVSAAGFNTVIDKFNFYLTKANPIPLSLRANYGFSGIVTDINYKVLGRLGGEGWLDFGLKDMDGYLEIKDLDAVHFQPYYGNFISERKLLAAAVNLRADLKSKSNDLSAKCHFELANLAYEAPAAQEEKPTIFSNSLDLFTNDQGKIILDFTLRTRFDQPSFNIRKFRSAVTKAAGQTLSKQPDKVIERMGNTFEQFREMFKKPKK